VRNIGAAVRAARRRAGLSQRELGERTGVPQSTVARIESGFVDPRTSTVVKLLAACGEEIEAVPRLGQGVDRTVIRQLLELDHQGRFDNAVASARNLKAFQESIEWTGTSSTPSVRSKH
jgi:transcriptional regulator with XRE-family HTH domain